MRVRGAGAFRRRSAGAVASPRQQAEAALARLRQLLAELGLAPKEAETRIVELAVGGEGVDSSASTAGGAVAGVRG